MVVAIQAELLLKQQDHTLAVRAHALVSGQAEGCPQCIEFAAALNRARSEAGYWQAMHQKALEREKELKQRNEELEAKLRERERQLFGRKSEKCGKGGEGSGGADKQSNGRRRGQQPGAEGHGRQLHEELEVVEEVCDLEENEKCCPRCGLPYEEFPVTEDSEEVEVEVRAYRRRHRRKQYRPTCSCPDQPGIVMAPAPAKLICKGGYAISFWVHLLLDKFLLQRPTYRLRIDLRLSMGVDVSQGTITDGLKRLMPLFEPLYEGIVAKSLSEEHWHADETRWKVFEKLEGKQGNRWYLWLFHSQSTVVYILDPSRSSVVPLEYFGEGAEGILSVDRYSAYKALLKWTKLLLQFCWAHVRRDFLAVAKDWPKQEQWALGWLEKIRDLYLLNEKRVALLLEPGAFAEADGKLREAIEYMERQRVEELADEALHPARRKVLESLERHWPGLLVFVEHPQVPMDNNKAERDIRGPAVGRKNYYGSGALWSGRLAAMLFSLFQTLLLFGINPRAWLTDYLRRCAENGGRAPEEAARYLPWNMTDADREAFILSGNKGYDTS